MFSTSLNRVRIVSESRSDINEGPSLFNEQADELMKRFEDEGRIIFLEEAIDTYREAVAFCPLGHSDRFRFLNNLANAVLTRFKQVGVTGDVEEAIELHRDALALCPPDHPDRSMSLNNLADAVMARFEHLRTIVDLEEVIELNRNALALRPPGHPYRSVSIQNLSHAMLRRFQNQQVGSIADLEEAIELNRNLALSSGGHPDRTMALSNLANAMSARFDHAGAIADLDESIELYRNSLALYPPDQHANRSIASSNLANAILKRYDQTDAIADLDEAIVLNRNVLALRPPRHPDRLNLLNNLASMVLRRYDLLEATVDLDEVIELYRNVLTLCPPGRPDRYMALNKLASALSQRYFDLWRIADLNEVIELRKSALALRPLGHPDYFILLNNLIKAVKTRLELKKEKKKENIGDVDELISLYRTVLALRPPGHPERSRSSNSFADMSMKRFVRTRNTQDLVEASKVLLDAEKSSSVHSPELCGTWILLAKNNIYQHQIDSDNNRLTTAFDLFHRAVKHDAAGFNQRFIAALHWVSAARATSHESLLHANSTALELLNRYVVASPSIERQMKLLNMSDEIPQSLALDAAASAIEAGQLRTAVEFLEQGRTLLWTGIRRFRHPIEDLRRTNPELASVFGDISRRLELLALYAEHPLVTDPGNNPEIITGDLVTSNNPGLPLFQTREEYDANILEQSKLSEEWDAVVEKIRLIDGFSNFLKSGPFSTLQSAAADGPVVVVNISDYRCDAIIIRDSVDPILVHLPNATPTIICDLYNRLYERFFLKDDSDEFCEVLGILWNIVVGPVVDELSKVGVEKGSRIWWCPTSYLCGMPLHAAGPFNPHEKNRSVRDQMWLPDLYVSSYTSSLSILMAARSNTVPGIEASSLLVIAETTNSGSLTHVEEEIRRIKKFDRTVESMVGKETTREAVLRRLPDYPYVHFACHGSTPNSLHSSFTLCNNERLELLDLIKVKLTNAQHAFLSASYGAAAYKGLPDEMISLTVALQVCGYRGVVGPLWKVNDEDRPTIAESFYGYMFRHGEDGKVDVKDSARALNIAIQVMKMRKGLIGRWINFIHIGI